MTDNDQDAQSMKDLREMDPMASDATLRERLDSCRKEGISPAELRAYDALLPIVFSKLGIEDMEELQQNFDLQSRHPEILPFPRRESLLGAASHDDEDDGSLFRG